MKMDLLWVLERAEIEKEKRKSYLNDPSDFTLLEHCTQW